MKVNIYEMNKDIFINFLMFNLSGWRLYLKGVEFFIDGKTPFS